MKYNVHTYVTKYYAITKSNGEGLRASMTQLPKYTVT